jgi:hypothetical protein
LDIEKLRDLMSRAKEGAVSKEELESLANLITEARLSGQDVDRSPSSAEISRLTDTDSEDAKEYYADELRERPDLMAKSLQNRILKGRDVEARKKYEDMEKDIRRQLLEEKAEKETNRVIASENTPEEKQRLLGDLREQGIPVRDRDSKRLGNIPKVLEKIRKRRNLE